MLSLGLHPCSQCGLDSFVCIDQSQSHCRELALVYMLNPWQNSKLTLQHFNIVIYITFHNFNLIYHIFLIFLLHFTYLLGRSHLCNGIQVQVRGQLKGVLPSPTVGVRQWDSEHRSLWRPLASPHTTVLVFHAVSNFQIIKVSHRHIFHSKKATLTLF